MPYKASAYALALNFTYRPKSSANALDLKAQESKITQDNNNTINILTFFEFLIIKKVSRIYKFFSFLLLFINDNGAFAPFKNIVLLLLLLIYYQ